MSSLHGGKDHQVTSPLLLSKGLDVLLTGALVLVCLWTAIMRLGNGAQGCTYKDQGEVIRTEDERFGAQASYFDCVLSIDPAYILVTDRRLGPMLLYPNEAEVSIYAPLLPNLAWRDRRTLLLDYPECTRNTYGPPVVAAWSEDPAKRRLAFTGWYEEKEWSAVTVLSNCHRANAG